MRIIQPFIKQHSQTTLGADFGAMHSLETYKTTIGGKAEVGVGTSQARQSIKRHATHSNKDGRGETRLRIEFKIMGVVVIRHIELKYPLPFNYSSLYI
jgi:hypothetical protein